MIPTEEEVEAHNRHVLWNVAAAHLRAAYDSLEQALIAFDDLAAPHIGENLAPVQESVGRFLALAEQKLDD